MKKFDFIVSVSERYTVLVMALAISYIQVRQYGILKVIMCFNTLMEKHAHLIGILLNFISFHLISFHLWHYQVSIGKPFNYSQLALLIDDCSSVTKYCAKSVRLFAYLPLLCKIFICVLCSVFLNVCQCIYTAENVPTYEYFNIHCILTGIAIYNRLLPDA